MREERRAAGTKAVDKCKKIEAQSDKQSDE